MLIFFSIFFPCLRFVLCGRMICLSLRFVLLLFVNGNGDCGCGMVIVVKCFWVSVLGLHFDKARDVYCKLIRALGLQMGNIWCNI